MQLAIDEELSGIDSGDTLRKELEAKYEDALTLLPGRQLNVVILP
jgi:hypothetical protein